MEIIIYAIVILGGLYLIGLFLESVRTFFKRKPDTSQNDLYGHYTEVSQQKAAEWQKEWAKKKILKIYYSKKSKKILQLILSADSYSLLILDRDLTLLKEVDIDLSKSNTFPGLTLRTFERGNDELIVLIHGLDYYQFDLAGVNIHKEHLTMNYDESLLVYHNSHEFTHTHDHSYGDVKTIWIDNNTTFTLDLLAENFYSDEDSFCFEYHLDIVSTNKKDQLAFIAHHANYGAQGIQIYEYGKSGKLNLLYYLHDEELRGTFHHLAFNPAGNQFTVLLYQRDDLQNDYFSILEYPVSGDKKPFRTIETRFGFWEHNISQTHYLTNRLFCVARNSDLIIYDLETGTLQEIIKRDLKSAFHLDYNVIVYQYNDKIIIKEYD